MPEAEHLLARQADPDRAFKLSRRQDREEQLILRTQTRTEGPADERRDDAHIVF